MTESIKDLQELIKQKDKTINLLMETIDSQKQTINTILSKMTSNTNLDLSNEEYINEISKLIKTNNNERR